MAPRRKKKAGGSRQPVYLQPIPQDHIQDIDALIGDRRAIKLFGEVHEITGVTPAGLLLLQSEMAKEEDALRKMFAMSNKDAGNDEEAKAEQLAAQRQMGIELGFKMYPILVLACIPSLAKNPQLKERVMNLSWNALDAIVEGNDLQKEFERVMGKKLPNQDEEGEEGPLAASETTEEPIS